MLVGERAWRLVRHAQLSGETATTSFGVCWTTPNPSSAASRRHSSGARTSSPRSSPASGAQPGQQSAPRDGVRLAGCRQDAPGPGSGRPPFRSRHLPGRPHARIRPGLDVRAAPRRPLRLAGGTIGSWATGVLAGERDGELVAARIAAAAGEAPATGPVEETAWAARRLLETLARERPLVLVLEDCTGRRRRSSTSSSMSPSSRERRSCCSASPDRSLETRPAWAGGRLNASSILLDALPPDQARVLLAGPRRRHRARRRQPFSDPRRRGRESALPRAAASALEGGDTTVPDSIHALLAARLDRLPEDERRVAQAAAADETFPTGCCSLSSTSTCAPR